MPWGFVAALSFAQLVSWGIVFYAFALFLEPMARELGWSKPALTLAYSLGLGASALTAYPSGRLIDKGHGRAVMTAGSLVSSALLVLWSRVDSYPLFVLIWIGLGATMSAVLYEPGFAVLTHRLGPLSRRGITVMTLVGGLASTVFFPLSYALIEALGWRDALVALAAINLAVCGAIHFLVIPSEPARAASGVSAAPGAAAPSSARRVLRHPAFWGFVIVSVLHNALFTGFAIHLVPLLVERGLTLAGAVAAFTLVGPAQVGGRIVIAVGERAFSMRAVGLLACGLAVAAFLLLPFVRPEPWFVVVVRADLRRRQRHHDDRARGAAGRDLRPPRLRRHPGHDERADDDRPRQRALRLRGAVGDRRQLRPRDLGLDRDGDRLGDRLRGPGAAVADLSAFR